MTVLLALFVLGTTTLTAALTYELGWRIHLHHLDSDTGEKP